MRLKAGLQCQRESANIRGWPRAARRQLDINIPERTFVSAAGPKKAPARVGPRGRQMKNSPFCEVELSLGRAALIGVGSGLRLDGNAKSAGSAFPPPRSAAHVRTRVVRGMSVIDR